jgi:hypothetical protein
MRGSLLLICTLFCVSCAFESMTSSIDARGSTAVTGDVQPSQVQPHALSPAGLDRLEHANYHPRDLEWHPVHLNPVGEFDVFPEDGEPEVTEDEYPSRRRVRMNIDQLDQAIRQVTGGLGWTEQNGNNEDNLFEELALTLGKPDFVELVIEDLSPSGLFIKFLDDAARSTCSRLVEEEYFSRSAQERVLLGSVSPNALYEDAAVSIDVQLVTLSLRYHGVLLPAGSGALENLRWLFQMAQWRAGEPKAGWEAVCVSLMTDPAFFSY